MKTRIFTLDIETSPIDAYAWQVWDANIAPNQIKTPQTILSWAGHFLGDKKKDTIYRMWNDEDMYEVLLDSLNKADIVVGYNQDKFDLRHINREFLLRGMGPSRPCASIDILKVVKQRFHFPHNRLDYVASVVLGEKKLETGGFDLWPAFMDGDSKAEKTMRKYNIKDVDLTERLYERLRPWVRNHPYTGELPEIHDGGMVYDCPVCSSTNLIRLRPRRTRCMAIRLLECMDCGAPSEGKRRKI